MVQELAEARGQELEAKATGQKEEASHLKLHAAALERQAAGHAEKLAELQKAKAAAEQNFDKALEQVSKLNVTLKDVQHEHGASVCHVTPSMT